MKITKKELTKMINNIDWREVNYSMVEEAIRYEGNSGKVYAILNIEDEEIYLGYIENNQSNIDYYNDITLCEINVYDLNITEDEMFDEEELEIIHNIEKNERDDEGNEYTHDEAINLYLQREGLDYYERRKNVLMEFYIPEWITWAEESKIKERIEEICEYWKSHEEIEE